MIDGRCRSRDRMRDGPDGVGMGWGTRRAGPAGAGGAEGQIVIKEENIK